MARKNSNLKERDLREYMYVVGIDNGVTGAITILRNDGVIVLHENMPVFTQQSYTKTKQNITRIDVDALDDYLSCVSSNAIVKVYIERPMVNPGRFKATVSALRALEATLIVLEAKQLPIEYIDSKEWQSKLLPKSKNKLDKSDTKKLALDIAKRLFPRLNKIVNADSLLIAEYGRRQLK